MQAERDKILRTNKNIGNVEAPVVQSLYIEKSFPKYTSRASGEAKISSREP